MASFHKCRSRVSEKVVGSPDFPEWRPESGASNSEVRALLLYCLPVLFCWGSKDMDLKSNYVIVL